MSIAQAVHASARFPFLSPVAEIGVDAADLAAALEIGKLSDRGMTTEQEMAIEARRLELSHERLIVRQAAWVDGGYFDNAGLMPAIVALPKISLVRQELLREAEPIRGVPPNSVRVIHFDNDPTEACLPLGENWLQEASPKVRRFFQVTHQRPKYVHELANVEAAMRSRPLQWLISPFEAMYAVRAAHAKIAKERLEVLLLSGFSTKSVYPFANDRLLEYSFADELNLVYGRDDCVRRSPDETWLVDSVKRARDELMSQAEEYVSRNFISRAVFDGYTVALEEWYAASYMQAKQMNCSLPNQAAKPPLGWTLSRDDRWTMDCLALRATIRQGIPSADPPRLIAICRSLTACEGYVTNAVRRREGPRVR
jgi:hypothetical protein